MLLSPSISSKGSFDPNYFIEFIFGYAMIMKLRSLVVVQRHALRNALIPVIPVIPVIGLSFGGALGAIVAGLSYVL